MEFNNRFVTARPRVVASEIVCGAAGVDVARSDSRIVTTMAQLLFLSFQF